MGARQGTAGIVSVAFSLLSGCAAMMPPDNGLIAFCWMDGVASDFTCDRPREFSWLRANIPLRVATAEDNPLLTEVIAEINSEVGCEIMTIPPELDPRREHTDVIVIFDAPFTYGERGIAYTTFRRAGTRVQAFVTLFALGHSREIMRNALFHELGHALGLAHDDWNGSIMRRAQDARVVGLSPYDRSLLASLYCGEASTRIGR